MVKAQSFLSFLTVVVVRKKKGQSQSLVFLGPSALALKTCLLLLSAVTSQISSEILVKWTSFSLLAYCFPYKPPKSSSLFIMEDNEETGFSILNTSCTALIDSCHFCLYDLGA